MVAVRTAGDSWRGSHDMSGTRAGEECLFVWKLSVFASLA